MSDLLIFLSLLLFGLLSFWKKELGIYLILLLLPSYQIRFQVFGIPSTFLEGMILILAFVVIASEARQSLNPIGLLRHFIPRNDVLAFILLLLTAATISIFTSPVPAKAAGIWKAFFVEPVIFSFLVLRIIDTKEKLRHLFLAVTILVIYLSIFGIYQFLTLANLPFSWWAVDVESRRIMSLLNHPNALALLLGPLLALLVFSSQKTKFHWMALILGPFALYLSFSRAAWLALILTVLGIGLFSSYRRKIITSGLVAVILILIIPFSRQKLLELTSRGDASRQNRIVLWTAAGDIIKKNPIAGAGLAGFHEEYKKYPLGPDRVVQNYPHNFFLNFWVETGLVGLIAITVLLILFFKQKPPLPFTAAMTVILLHGMVDVPYFKNDLSVLFWTIYALGFIKTLRSGSSPVLSETTSGRSEISS